jgi:hypothetical protein
MLHDAPFNIYSSFEELEQNSRRERIAVQKPNGLGIGIKGGRWEGLPIGVLGVCTYHIHCH